MADELVDALVDAYRPHVEALLAGRGVDVDVADALDEGEAWLREALTNVLAQPFEEQTRGPLELFQEAMRYPTKTLRNAGIPAVARDQVTANALPGDVYDLAPASSRDLGDQVWHAHLRWGARKAEALRHRD